MTSPANLPVHRCTTASWTNRKLECMTRYVGGFVPGSRLCNVPLSIPHNPDPATKPSCKPNIQCNSLVVRNKYVYLLDDSDHVTPPWLKTALNASIVIDKSAVGQHIRKYVYASYSSQLTLDQNCVLRSKIWILPTLHVKTKSTTTRWFALNSVGILFMLGWKDPAPSFHNLAMAVSTHISISSPSAIQFGRDICGTDNLEWFFFLHRLILTFSTFIIVCKFHNNL